MNSKKIVALLESNVQWLAIALGAAWLGWMAWTYVVNVPVTLTLGQDVLSPGDVDSYIDQHDAVPLAAAMRDKATLPANAAGSAPAEPFPDISTDQYAFSQNIFTGTVQGVALPNPTPGPTGPNLVPVVTQLPTLPQVTIVDSQGGRSSIVPGSETGQAAPAPAAGGAAATAQPPQDCIWAAVKFSIPAKNLEAAFNAVNIPPAVRKTTFLRVMLVREEEEPGSDNWGPEREVKLLANIAAKLPNLPPEGDPASAAAAQQTYLTMAQIPQNVGYILQPPFYQVVKGDQPFVVIPPPPFDPTKDYTDDEKALMTPEQRQAIADYQAKKAAELRKQRQQQQQQRQPTPPSRGPSGYPGGGGYPGGPPRNNLVADPQHDAQDARGTFFAPAPAQPPSNAPRGDDGDNPPPPGAPPARQPERGPGIFGAPQPPQPQQGQQPEQAAGSSLPGGDFFPSQVAGDIIGWAYDESVLPGHIYRYRVVYMIKNPIWGSFNIAKDPVLAQRFILSSDDGSSAAKAVWTPRVSVPSLTTIYMASNVLSSTDHSVRIRVFKWQSGEVKSRQYEVMPGDAIGRKESDGDYATGYVLVDAESQSDTPDSGAYMLVMDDHGNLVRHEWRTDRAQQAQEAAGVSAQATAQPRQ